MRREFSQATKKAAWARCGKRCEKCGTPFDGRRPQYDHVLADGLFGEPTLENCQVLCSKCHKIKTHEHDRPMMQKADNIAKKEAGQKRKFQWPKQKFNQWRRSA
jgi:5-methylcytosine-specific restriction protein A